MRNRFIKPVSFTCEYCGFIFETPDYTHNREGCEGQWWNRALCPKCNKHTIQKEEK